MPELKVKSEKIKSKETQTKRGREGGKGETLQKLHYM